MSRQTILISGMLAGDPYQGGATWAVLQYVLGFRELGHEVIVVEPIRRDSPLIGDRPLEQTDVGRYFHQVVEDFQLQDSAALLVQETHETLGLDYRRLQAAAERADLLINISGMLTDESLLGRIERRVYLDLDPAFNQLWHAQGIDMRFAHHTHHVTIAQALGQPDCLVPDCGIRWLKTWQPVVLSAWPVATHLEHDAFTTIGNWRGYGSVTHGEIFFGQKAHSFRQFMELPSHTRSRLLVAMAIHPGETADLEALDRNRWQRIEPREVANTPGRYQRFVQGSRGELGIAKSGYVVSRCGWFSDRSVCYLASGRPVLAQDTGLSGHLPAESGLLLFRTLEEAAQGLERLDRDYDQHRRAARRLAEEFFDSRQVLTRFLQMVQ